MSCYEWAWLGMGDTCHAMGGMGGHRLLLMGVIWIWVQIQRKCWALEVSSLSGMVGKDSPGMH